ncbi:triacylglycerol lipase [Cooperia oncophora]
MLKEIIFTVLLTSLAISMPVFDKPARFSDEFARTKVVPLCAATELDDPRICINKAFKNVTVLHKVTVPCDKNTTDTCSGYTAVNHEDKAIMLVFRGTVGNHQMATESAVTLFAEQMPWIAGGKVSRYFYNAFFAVWNGGIKDDFVTVANKYKDYELWAVGHSLGGSMASLASSYVVKTKLFDGNRIKLVTFGQPRTGNKDYADAHDAQVPYSFRVTHAHDTIPHNPPKGFHNYTHHKSEVFYNNDMTTADYIECDEQESKSCSDQNINLSFYDHHRYYNVYIYNWGAVGCIGDPANPPTFAPKQC